MKTLKIAFCLVLVAVIASIILNHKPPFKTGPATGVLSSDSKTKVSTSTTSTSPTTTTNTTTSTSTSGTSSGTTVTANNADTTIPTSGGIAGSGTTSSPNNLPPSANNLPQTDATLALNINTQNATSILSSTSSLHLAGFFDRVKYDKKDTNSYNPTARTYSIDPNPSLWIGALGPKTFRYPSGSDSAMYHLWVSNTDHTLAKGYGFRQADITFNTTNFGQSNITGYYGSPTNYLNYQNNTLPGSFITDFEQMANADGAKVVLVANIGTGTPEEAVAMVKHIKDAGVPILSVSLGNETYNTDQYTYHGNASEYLAAALPFAKALADYDPSIPRLLVVAPYLPATNPSFTAYQAWDQTIKNAIGNTMYNSSALYTGIDAHRYQNFKCDLATVDANFKCFADRLGWYFDQPSQQAIRDTYGVNVYQRTIPEYFSYLSSTFPNIPIYITEWNMAKGNSAVDSSALPPDHSGTLLQAMYAMDFQNFVNSWNASHHNQIKNATYHNIAGYSAFCLICDRDTTNGETFVDVSGSKYNRHTEYFAFKFLSNVYRNNLKIASTTVTTDPSINLDVTTYVSSDGTLYVYFVNPSGKTVAINSIKKNNSPINLSTNATLSKASGSALYATRGIGYWNGVQNGGPQVSISEGESSALNQIVIPGYSFGFIKVNN